MVDESVTDCDYAKMFPERIKLLYEIRDALGWNDKTALSLIPEEIKALKAENERLIRLMNEDTKTIAKLRLRLGEQLLPHEYKLAHEDSL